MKTYPSFLKTEGDAVLQRSTLVDVKAVKSQLQRFTAAHQTWGRAQELVERKESTETDARLALGELDARQDLQLDALVDALVRAGFKRLSPLSSFTTQPASKLKKAQPAVEADLLQKLAKRVSTDKKADATSKKAAKTMSSTAQQVIAANLKADQANIAAHAARRQRDRLATEWAKAYALLKQAAKLEEDSGGAAVFTTLFGEAKRSPTKKSAVAAAAPAASAPAPLSTPDVLE